MTTTKEQESAVILRITYPAGISLETHKEKSQEEKDEYLKVWEDLMKDIHSRD